MKNQMKLEIVLVAPSDCLFVCLPFTSGVGVGDGEGVGFGAGVGVGVEGLYTGAVYPPL